MDFNTFLISVFCLIDDWLTNMNVKLRQRGPETTLDDSEVLTIEIIGAFLGLETDSDTFRYFRRHYADWFPALQQVHRTTYVRQTANLWGVKAMLWRTLLSCIDYDPTESVIDSIPVPVCRFARAYRCRRLQEWSAYGHDEVARQTFFGLRAHLRICWPGVITELELLPADVHETEVAEQMMVGLIGTVLADRNYWKPVLAQRWREQGLLLLAPFKTATHEKVPWPTELKHRRYRIETVFSQLTGRFKAKRVWARDAWHLCSRWLRRIVSHLFGVYFCQQLALPSLQFAKIIRD